MLMTMLVARLELPVPRVPEGRWNSENAPYELKANREGHAPDTSFLLFLIMLYVVVLCRCVAIHGMQLRFTELCLILLLK